MTAQRPEPSSPRDFLFPAFERATLSNGMRLIVAPMHRLPVVTAILVLDGGAMTEPRGAEGVADILAHALTEGTHNKTADQLVMALERLGTSVSASADWESTILKMTVMSRNLDNALSLMSEMVTTPRLEEQSIGRLRAERLSEIIQNRTEPSVLADEMFAASLYAGNSRYAIPVGGSDESVSAIGVESVVAYQSANYQPSNATLILAGDVTVATGGALAAKAFSQWRCATAAAPVLREVEFAPRHSVRVVDRPGAQQSELRMGHAGALRSNPEYFSLVVMNAVLGGLFSSRINLNLREVHGYTYGASSYFDWRRDKGPFVISSAVQSEVTGAAITEVLGEIEKIRTSEITNDELTLATSYLAGVFPIRYETSEAVASGLASLVIFNLADDYFTSYRSNILAVSPKAVQRVAKDFLYPNQISIVVSGNPAIVGPQLATLGAGDVEIEGAGK